MPPKKDDSSGNQNLLDLIHLIATAPEIKLDMNALAIKMGIAQSRNVPRRINAIISPFGYELKGGRIVENRKSTSYSIPNTTSEDLEHPGEGKSELKTKKPAKTIATTPAPKSQKQPPAKKRKVENVDPWEKIQKGDDNMDDIDDDVA